MDAERFNSERWNNVLRDVEDTFEKYVNSSLKCELQAYSSLEERGFWCLYDCFDLLMVGETDKLKVVSDYTFQVLNAAIENKKYGRYRHAWGLEGMPKMNDLELAAYELEGEMTCRWYLRMLEIINGNIDDSQQRRALELGSEYWEKFANTTRYQSKSFLDKYCFMWLSFNAYQNYIEICDSSRKLDFSSTRKPNYRNKGGVAYHVCRAIMASDKKALHDLLLPQYKRSRLWDDVSHAEYPWWERMTWLYVSYAAYKERTDAHALEVMWADLRGDCLE